MIKRDFMASSRVMLSVYAVLAFLLILPAIAETSQWKLSWVNQRQEPDLADSWFELFPMSIVKNQGHAEYDGGYTVHIHLKQDREYGGVGNRLVIKKITPFSHTSLCQGGMPA
jgi:hypothetical protein